MYNIFYHSHAGSWAFLIIFFLLSYFFQKQKWLPMILRLFYVIMLVSGISMLVLLNFPLLYIVKGILAIGLIGVTDMLILKKRKEEPHTLLWVLYGVLLILILLIGFDVIRF